MAILDLLTLISFIALGVAIVLQMRRIYRTKSSHDLSIVGLSIRYVANSVILIKVIQISDRPDVDLMSGVTRFNFTAYLAIAFYYREKHVAVTH